jgi:hypothetical protein
MWVVRIGWCWDRTALIGGKAGVAGSYNRNVNAPYLSKAVALRCLVHPNAKIRFVRSLSTRVALAQRRRARV